MMKLTVFCVVLLIGFVPIISQESNLENAGAFHYSLGSRISDDAGVSGEAFRRQFSLTGERGQEYIIQHTADENGDQLQFEHIPTPPPIPDQIVRALDYLATAPLPKDEKQL